MGRKRTSNKRNLNLWVDRDLVENLHKLKLTPSVVFTEAVEDLLQKIENGEIEIKEKEENDEK